MDLQYVNEYIGRKVCYSTIANFEGFNKNINLDSTVVAIYFHRLFRKDNKLFFLKKIISCNPLAIFLSGKESHNSFNLLLEMLSKQKEGGHVMTYIEDGSDWIPSFFYSTWPSEERHDFWKEYLVIEIGNNKYLNDIEKFIVKDVGL
ncbi:MAG: hypothetical protein D3920_13005 [Candidatus Electrothrix sp. AW2]|nr:hypothetical protein [Candidatus Electrothrix gigas]